MRYDEEDLARQLGELEKARRGRRLLGPVAAIAVIALAAFAVWWFFIPPDYSAYADDTVRIEGLSETPFDISVRDLAALGCEYADTTGKTQTGAKTSASGYGPTLDTLMGAYGHDRGDFVKVRFYCRDDYKVFLRKADLEDYDTIMLAIADPHGPLRATSQPMRLIVVGGDANMWCYAVSRIEFLETDPGVERDSTDHAQQPSDEGLS